MAELWVDKYKPKDTSAMILETRNVLMKLNEWLDAWTKKPPREIYKRAVLISGPPGVGKTTIAHLTSLELHFTPIEFNASDARSKKSLQEDVADALKNRSITSFFGIASVIQGKGAVLIMDEVDGMAGGDRGGVMELIKMIKTTKVPIICICNDRGSPKVRSLVNHCIDLRFKKPTKEQIANRLMEISKLENVKLTLEGALAISTMADGDIRQSINILHMRSFGRNNNLNPIRTEVVPSKDVEVTSFEVLPKLFNYLGSNTDQKLSWYFSDSDMLPLFVQENYIKTNKPRLAIGKNTHIGLISKAAEDISCSDVLSRAIRQKSRWDLLPEHAFMSCIMPSYSVQGILSGGVTFPTWLGKYSSENKNKRLLKELQMHMCLATGRATSHDIGVDYVPILAKKLTKPLAEKGTDGIPEVITLMDGYELSREDCDSVLDIWGLPPPLIPSAVKSAFTRKYNSTEHKLSGAGTFKAKKTSTKVEKERRDEDDDDDLPIFGEDSEKEEEQSDKLVKKVAVSASSSKKRKKAPTPTPALTLEKLIPLPKLRKK